MMIMRNYIIILILIIIPVHILGQQNQETIMKREITLYNPYKPSLPDVMKKSPLPNIVDTSKVRHEFSYEVNTTPFMPPYNISPIKAASLIPDPLPKLYNSYVNIGFGNYITPLAEISITNERSKKGAIGLYAGHFSTNGKVELQNLEKVFAGYMDNDVSLFGRKFYRRSQLYGSLDFNQKSRYAYGYDTSFADYSADKKDIKREYINTGANIGYASDNLDSSKLSYDFSLEYKFFHAKKELHQHLLEFAGTMSKLVKGFYAGAGMELDFYVPSDSVSINSRYLVALKPTLEKATAEWNFRLGFQAVVDKGLVDPQKLHLYPDVRFGFNIIPAYMSFFAELSGQLEKNDPAHVTGINPFLIPGVSLFTLRNTDYALIVRAGFKGETGLEGNYKVSASYSLVNNMLFYTNSVVYDGITVLEYGNNFNTVYDDVEILNVHGDMGGKLTDKISFETEGNYYRYTLSESDHAWNRPQWDAMAGLRYNLRDKISAGVNIDARGSSYALVTSTDIGVPGITTYQQVQLPSNLTFGLNAEYRYTKILSFWLRFNNISFSRNYEWAFYPSQRFMCLVGFSYSL